jgi:Reductase C-terminal
MDLRNQRTRRIDRFEAQSLRAPANRSTDSVGGEDDPRAARHLLLGFNEDGTSRSQATHDVHVVNDLLAHLDRRTRALERELDRLDSTIDSCAIATRRDEQEPPDPESTIAQPGVGFCCDRGAREHRLLWLTPATDEIDQPSRSCTPHQSHERFQRASTRFITASGGHWTSAAAGGAAVARRILGLPPAPTQPAFFWSDQFGLRLQLVGDPAYATVGRIDGDPDAFTVRYHDDNGCLVAALAANRFAEVAALRRDLAVPRERALAGC